MTMHLLRTYIDDGYIYIAPISVDMAMTFMVDVIIYARMRICKSL